MKNDNEIVDMMMKLLQGKLDDQKADTVWKAIKEDPEMAHLFLMIRAFDTARRNEQHSGDSKAAKTLSKQLFRDFQKGQKNPDACQGIRVYDSGVLPVPEGVRPAAVDTRRMKYRIDDFVVEICVYPVTPDSYELIGQIIGHETTEKLSVEIKDGRRSRTASSDEFHLFRFEQVRAGEVLMTVWGENKLMGTIELSL